MRHLLTATFLAAATTLALGAVPQAASATVIGLGDQSAKIFQDKRFTALSKVKVVRYIAPWDVENDPARRTMADDWITAARAKGYLVHLTFNYSSRTPERNPSVAAYTKATKAFVDRHRADVETWGVFNEVNRGAAPGRFTTPGPKLAAQLFQAFRTKVCLGCKTVGVDLLDGRTVIPTLRYLTEFKRALGAVRPKIYGFHNYSDTNRASMERTAAFLDNVKGGQVWITETGGLYRLGSTFTPDSRRQAAATRQVFAIAKKYPRLGRVYLYNFYGPGKDRPDDVFDSGLVSGAGNARLSYDIVKSRLG